MNTTLFAILAVTAALLLAPPSAALADKEDAGAGKWSGVDETVVERFAEAAGRPARDPYINVDKGDILLFCFLIGGAVGGFLLGYCFRMLFHETPRDAVAAPKAAEERTG